MLRLLDIKVHPIDSRAGYWPCLTLVIGKLGDTTLRHPMLNPSLITKHFSWSSCSKTLLSQPVRQIGSLESDVSHRKSSFLRPKVGGK